jgi:multiple sugar transport system substrate-binding protein
MRRFRAFINVAMALAMVASITLMTGVRAIAAPSYSTVTVSLAGWASTPAEPDNLRKVLANFEKKYPNIKVNYEVINTDFETKMETELTAGTAPDVFYLDSSWLGDFASTGRLMSLNSFAKKDKAFDEKDFYKPLVRAFTYKGRIYGFPKDYSTLVLWYNKDMFKAAHISHPPTTWAELQADACKLTNKSKHIYGISLSADPARWLAFVVQAGGWLLNSHQTKATINSKAGKEALDFYAGLVKKGCAAEPSTMGAGWNGEAFGKGDAAMAIEGNWLIAPMQQQWPSIHYGIAPLPKGPKGSGNLIFTVAYVMNAQTHYPKQAWDLISYLEGKKGMKQWVDLGGYLPSRKSITPPKGTAVFVHQVKYAHPWTFPPGFTEALNNIGTELDKAMRGEVSTSEALSYMESQANAALSRP